MQNLRMLYSLSGARERNPLCIASQGQDKATKIITYQESQIAKNHFACAWYVCILLSASLQLFTSMHLYRINEHGDTKRTHTSLTEYMGRGSERL